MPVGTTLHEKTLSLCQGLSYRDWSGCYTVSVYETHTEQEYSAIRNAAASIDVASVEAGGACAGSHLQVEYTVEAIRRQVSARVVPLPFFNPPRKTGTPIT